jgi:ribonucleoside-triphosphate reductase
MVNSAKEIIDRLTVNPKKLRQNATAKDEKIKDFLLRENSNFVENIQLIYHNIQNHEDEKYLFEEIFEPEVQKLYKDGTIYVHDKKLMVYCNSLSCREIATK